MHAIYSLLSLELQLPLTPLGLTVLIKHAMEGVIVDLQWRVESAKVHKCISHGTDGVMVDMQRTMPKSRTLLRSRTCLLGAYGILYVWFMRILVLYVSVHLCARMCVCSYCARLSRPLKTPCQTVRVRRCQIFAF